VKAQSILRYLMIIVRIQIDPKFVAKLLKQETPFLLRVVNKANKIKEAIKPKILKKWSNALQATIPAAIQLENFIVSTNRKTILLGHSLGGRVALKTMEFIHSKKLEPISCIAMAPAILCSELNIQHLRNRANKIEVFFSESDMVLSLIYRIAELTNEKPIGLAGANFKISREINYSIRNKQSIGHNNYEVNLASLLSESEIFQKHI
jgi:predicted alpha/beta hydrolase family esterase